MFSGSKAEHIGVLTPDAKGDIVASLKLDLTKYGRMELDLQPESASAPGGQIVISGDLN